MSYKKNFYLLISIIKLIFINSQAPNNIFTVVNSTSVEIPIADLSLNDKSSKIYKDCYLSSLLSNYRLFYIFLPLDLYNNFSCGTCYKIDCVYIDNICQTSYSIKLYSLGKCTSCKSNEVKISFGAYLELGLSMIVNYKMNITSSNCSELTKGDEANLQIGPAFSRRFFTLQVMNTINQIKSIKFNATTNNDMFYLNETNKTASTVSTFTLRKDKFNRFIFDLGVLVDFPIRFLIEDTKNNTGLFILQDYKINEKYSFFINDKRNLTSPKTYKVISYFFNKKLIADKDVNKEIIINDFYYNHTYNEDIWVDRYYKSIPNGYAYPLYSSYYRKNNEDKIHKACEVDERVNTTGYVSVNSKLFNLSYACNQCVEIICTDKSKCNLYSEIIHAFIYDECPSCSENEIKVSTGLYTSNFNNDLTSVMDVKWKLISCKKIIINDNSLYIKLNSRSNNIFISLLISNHEFPIREVFIREKFTEIRHRLSREHNNYWSVTLMRRINYPYILEVYDVKNDYGSVLINSTSNNYTIIIGNREFHNYTIDEFKLLNVVSCLFIKVEVVYLVILVMIMIYT